MKLIVEPDDGVAPLLAAIKGAKKSVEIVVFRMDRSDLEAALKAAVARGVKVSALIAYANRGGEKSLRKLEMRLLDAGITVARTSDDLTRYHDKLLIIDRRVLYMLSFNFTHLDVDYSRGFGIVTTHSKWVQEAIRLLESDSTRTSYTPGMDTFVVSPANSRKVLARFLRHAKQQLLIYDPKISDKEMVRILEERAKAGVEIRIIGQINEQAHLPVRALTKSALHTRTIIRDRHQAFIGSQSLRALELDSRREVGLIVRDSQTVRRLIDTFESDWPSSTDAAEDKHVAEKAPPISEVDTKKAIRVLVEELHPVTQTVKRAVQKVVDKAGEEVLEDKIVKNTVKKVVKKAMKEAVKEVVEDVRNA